MPVPYISESYQLTEDLEILGLLCCPLLCLEHVGLGHVEFTPLYMTNFICPLSPVPSHRPLSSTNSSSVVQIEEVSLDSTATEGAAE